MPGGAIVVREKGVRRLFRLGVLAIERLREHADFRGKGWVARGEKGDLGGEEHGTGGEHNGRVVDDIVDIKGR